MFCNTTSLRELFAGEKKQSAQTSVLALNASQRVLSMMRLNQEFKMAKWHVWRLRKHFFLTSFHSRKRCNYLLKTWVEKKLYSCFVITFKLSAANITWVIAVVQCEPATLKNPKYNECGCSFAVSKVLQVCKMLEWMKFLKACCNFWDFFIGVALKGF